MTRNADIHHNWTKYAAWFAALLLFAMLLASCGSNDGSNSGSSGGDHAGQQTADDGGSPANADAAGSEADSGEHAAADAGKETVYPLTVTDKTGTAITLERAPERVVMLGPSDTEIVFAIGAGSLAVGADEYSNYPPEAAELPRVGDMNTNIEAVASLNPDLVLGSASMNAAAVDALRQLGITVYASDPQTLEETIAHIEQVGVLLNHQAGAEAVAAEMRAAIQYVADKVKDAEPLSVYLEFSPGWTVGSGTFLDELVKLAGGVNISADQSGWFEVDSEAVIQRNPEVIIYPEIEGVDLLGEILSRPGWDQIEAVKNDRVHAVTNDPLVRVGPRLTDGLKEIAAAIHPDLFP
ncbi:MULTISPECIES: ABC transporter substrate-binding protein [Thermobacillus]|uniref:ABC-type Fe3+-hydroxamate transport system, periplasmic component n=1 Tax=Thermobacillus composti (strain DSM 18247 / JCM 13945 / KWC4) TaxID=717605 RepID=L0EBS1_THECK|nr:MULTISPECIES: ABC transporter substrate-binding protein [Thermobacillus]AGA57713.1 ABC-type Fe3+-hydroxamate transport system, periplasmic component [Thermobacillus composti KWC4]